MIYFDPVNCYVNASTDEALFWGGTSFINTLTIRNPIKSRDMPLHKKLPAWWTGDLYLGFSQQCRRNVITLCAAKSYHISFSLSCICMYMEESQLWIFCMFLCALADTQKCTAAPSEGSLSTRSAGEKETTHSQPLAALISSAECWLFPSQRINFFFAVIAVKQQMDEPTFSGRDLAGLTLNIFDMSSELRCWATSHSLAVMSIRRQMSMSTLLAFSWILVSRSDICCRGEGSCFRWHVQAKHLQYIQVCELDLHQWR